MKAPRTMDSFAADILRDMEAYEAAQKNLCPGGVQCLGGTFVTAKCVRQIAVTSRELDEICQRIILNKYLLAKWELNREAY